MKKLRLKDRQRLSFLIDIFLIHLVTLEFHSKLAHWLWQNHFFSFLVCFVGYFTFAYSTRSLGMILMDLRLSKNTIEHENLSTTTKDAFIRALALLLQFLTLGLVATQLLGEKEYYWHDYLSGTHCMDINDYEILQDELLYLQESLYIDVNSLEVISTNIDHQEQTLSMRKGHQPEQKPAKAA